MVMILGPSIISISLVVHSHPLLATIAVDHVLQGQVDSNQTYKYRLRIAPMAVTVNPRITPHRFLSPAALVRTLGSGARQRAEKPACELARRLRAAACS